MGTDCELSIMLGADMVAGMEGEVEIGAQEPLERAKALHLVYSVRSDRHAPTSMHEATLRFDLPAGGLANGVHTYPFRFGLPPGGMNGRQVHRLDARLEIGWAIDPTCRREVTLVMASAPSSAPTASGSALSRVPVSIHSPPAFHPELVLDVSLASAVVAADEPLYGQIALRSGRADGVIGASIALTETSSGIVRAATSVGREDLRDGAPAPFAIPGSVPGVSGSEQFGLVIKAIVVSAPASWAASTPCLEIPLRVVPRGATISGAGALAPIGRDRLRRFARSIAERTGLAASEPPVLMEAAVGPVRVRVYDHAVGSQLGFVVELRYPDVGLGLVLTKRVLPGEDEASPLSPALRSRFNLRFEERAHRPPLADDVGATFAAELAHGLELADELELSDEHLRARFAFVDDDGARVVPLAIALLEKAQRLRDALTALPSASSLSPESAVAWAATATDTGAFLVPSVPLLDRVPLAARLLGGGELMLFATVKIAYSADGPRTVASIDLSGSPLPPDIDDCAAIGRSIATMAAVRATFPEIEVRPTQIILARAGFTEDPRALLPALDELLSWILEVRGLRRAAAAPYR